jgi:Acetyltransferases
MKMTEATNNLNAPLDLSWITATPRDEADVLTSLRAFYEEEKLVFDPQAVPKAIRALLERPELGQIFLLKASGEGARYGHLVVTWGFSLEFRGRFVLLDEIYLAPAARGQGWGKRCIQFVETWARERGAAAVRLEVNHANKHAKAFYERMGFGDDRRDLMTRWL